MDPLAVAVPLHERLAGEAESNQHELPVKPVVLEPEKQVGAEDDGKGTKPIYSSPRDQNRRMSKVYANNSCPSKSGAKS